MLLIAVASWALVGATTLIPSLPYQAEAWLQMTVVAFASSSTAVAGMYGWVWFTQARRQSRGAARGREARRKGGAGRS